ncbi:hypothetical protein N7495_003711 [Penicillium taxi]|uniref:uncharacterized protein n=1 Tax=Penicillium taxi TaxID=168475 RepID=UPI0025455FA0|nr:uncharacterized protein N7495_003711 [Penicillium taxi]KAJ5898967.1 hypothetical protein N7495_003711 [Penicillium taxi]
MEPNTDNNVGLLPDDLHTFTFTSFYFQMRYALLTRAIECPLRLSLHATDDYQLRLTSENINHNHGPSEHISSHPAHRRLELNQKSKLIQNQLQQGTKPRQIITRLRIDDPQSCLIDKDLYNFIQKTQLEYLAGRTPIQALIDDLPEDGK